MISSMSNSLSKSQILIFFFLLSNARSCLIDNNYVDKPQCGHHRSWVHVNYSKVK